MSTSESVFPPADPQYHPMARLAVFIDIENFAGYCADMGVPVDIAPVLEHLSQHHGRIQIKRSFGDVSSLPGPAFNPYRIRRMLQAHQIDHLDIPHRPTSYSKNSADIRLAVEAVALIHQRPEITHIVVVSNDRDFIPLFNHAREHGKLVIGCGPRRSSVNEDYRNACDVFLFHEDWVATPGMALVPAQGTPDARPPASAPMLTAQRDTPDVASVNVPPALAEPVAAVPTVAVPDQPDMVAPEEPLSLFPAPSSVPDSAWQPSSYFPETAEPALPGRLSASRSVGVSAGSGQDEPIDCLLAALRSIQAEGGAMMASRVAARMKELFPEFDVKKLFGSFKQFCIEQEKTGHISLHNLGHPNFTIAIENRLVHPDSMDGSEAQRHLLTKYRDWSFQKLKISFPSPAVRRSFYDILVQVLNDRSSQSDFIPLQELSRLCSIPLSAVTVNAKDVAFRLCYSLYRGKAFTYYRTDSAFNPDIIDLAVHADLLEECVINNTRASFIHDSQNHGLPLDEAVLARLMQGSAGADSWASSPQPAVHVLTANAILPEPERYQAEPVAAEFLPELQPQAEPSPAPEDQLEPEGWLLSETDVQPEAVPETPSELPSEPEPVDGSESRVLSAPESYAEPESGPAPVEIPEKTVKPKSKARTKSKSVSSVAEVETSSAAVSAEPTSQDAPPKPKPKRTTSRKKAASVTVPDVGTED